MLHNLLFNYSQSSPTVNRIAVTTPLLASALHRCQQRTFKKNTNYSYDFRISILLGILSEIFIQIGYFLSRVSILTRDIDKANLSVRPSVTFWYCMKTA